MKMEDFLIDLISVVETLFLRCLGPGGTASGKDLSNEKFRVYETERSTVFIDNPQ